MRPAPRRSIRFAPLLAAAALAAGCAAPLAPGPVPLTIAPQVTRTLLDGVLLEGASGRDRAYVSLHEVKGRGSPELLVLVQGPEDAPPCAIYLPAKIDALADGAIVTLFDAEGRRFELAVPGGPSGPSFHLEASLQAFGGAEARIVHEDGREDVVEVEIERDGEAADVSIRFERLAAPSYLGTWRELLEERGPITVRLRRARSYQHADVWVAAGPATPSLAEPKG